MEYPNLLCHRGVEICCGGVGGESELTPNGYPDLFVKRSQFTIKRRLGQDKSMIAASYEEAA